LQVRTTAYVSNVAITANLLTVTTAAAHGITQVGTLANISGVSTVVDGAYVIQSVPSASTYTAVSATTTLASVAVSPVGVSLFTPVSSGFLVTNRVIQNYIATITTSAAHGLAVGDYTIVNINQAGIDSFTGVQVTGIPTTTTFTFLSATQTLATAAVTQGAMGRTTFQASYTVAAATQGVSSTLYVANTSGTAQTYRIALQKGGAALANQFVAYDTVLAANSTTAFTTGIALNAGEIATVQASSNLVIFTLDGSESA
jgi:hypothetical protein